MTSPERPGPESSPATETAIEPGILSALRQARISVVVVGSVWLYFAWRALQGVALGHMLGSTPFGISFAWVLFLGVLLTVLALLRFFVALGALDRDPTPARLERALRYQGAFWACVVVVIGPLVALVAVIRFFWTR